MSRKISFCRIVPRTLLLYSKIQSLSDAQMVMHVSPISTDRHATFVGEVCPNSIPTEEG